MLYGKSWNELYSSTRVYYEIRAARTGDDHTFLLRLLDDMHTLDAKSTGLITFISVALAALIFALSIVDATMEHATVIKTGLVCFMGIFALAAWFSLRCLEISGPPFTDVLSDVEAQKDQSITELAVRRYNYFVALRLTRYAFAFLVLFVLFWLGLVVRHSY